MQYRGRGTEPAILTRSRPTSPPPPSSRPGWLPLAATGAFILVMLALVAGLFAAQSGQRRSTSSAPSTTPVTSAATSTGTTHTTATPSGPRWQPITSYAHIPGLVLAPSNPRTAYQTLLNTSKTSPTTLTLQRTRDAGATWQPLALPQRLQGLSPDAFDSPLGVMVSPLEPNMLYLTAMTPMTSCPNAIGQASVVEVAYRSSQECFTQYYSADGGVSWHDLTLPVSNLLTGTYDGNSAKLPLRAQGARLYALISPPFVAQDTTAPAGRLATSTDGGISWTLADSGLPTSVGIVDYAPAPSGSTIFVVSDRIDRFNSGVCGGCLPPPDYKLWRSDDAGGHWTQIATLPYQSVQSLFVASGGATPALYLLVWTGTGKDSRALLSSGDGGRSWSPVPATGIDASASLFQGVWGVLADGSVIAAYSPPGDGQYTNHTFYAWKRGDAGWRALAAPLFSPFLIQLLVGAPAADGSQTLTLLYQDHDGNLVATLQIK